MSVPTFSERHVTLISIFAFSGGNSSDDIFRTKTCAWPFWGNGTGKRVKGCAVDNVLARLTQNYLQPSSPPMPPFAKSRIPVGPTQSRMPSPRDGTSPKRPGRLGRGVHVAHIGGRQPCPPSNQTSIHRLLNELHEVASPPWSTPPDWAFPLGLVKPRTVHAFHIPGLFEGKKVERGRVVCCWVDRLTRKSTLMLMLMLDTGESSIVICTYHVSRRA